MCDHNDPRLAPSWTLALAIAVLAHPLAVTRLVPERVHTKTGLSYGAVFEGILGVRFCCRQKGALSGVIRFCVRVAWLWALGFLSPGPSGHLAFYLLGFCVLFPTPAVGADVFF